MAPTQLPGKMGYLDWTNWAYGLFSGFISGGASAVISGTVVAIKDPKDFAVGSANFFQLVGWVFLTAGVLAAMNFLHNKPLPTYVQTETTTKRIEIEATNSNPIPPSPTVITTTKETVINGHNAADIKKDE